ncbi:protein HEXIM1 [Prorops nasuta]|uniref:protein HEXIM1 n=1 Tax=Prorops nasuta TaxID=863751 RepID=UPI0034CF3C32
MELESGNKTIEKIDIDSLCDAEAVQASSASSTSMQVSPPVRTTRPITCLNGHHVHKVIGKGIKFESGSGSGEQDSVQPEDSTDVGTKKRKTRRGKPKHRKLKPYSKQHLTYQQQMKRRILGRLIKAGRQPPAPYNTTQFLMNDHSDLPNLEQKLSEASDLPPNFHKPQAPPRTRDSSFSVDSDEDYFYSSPEDEEEFLTKEFSSAYEDLHAERLGTLTKSELIQEYIQLEAKVDLLTKRLRGKNLHQMEEQESDSKSVATTEIEMAKKLKICQQRIEDLTKQNEQLRRENDALRTVRKNSPIFSIDSESDSDSSSSGEAHSSCSCHQCSTDSSSTYKSFK